VLRQEYYILVFFWIRRVQVRNLTGQQDNQSLTINFVGDFSFLARFWGILGYYGENETKVGGSKHHPLEQHPIKSDAAKM